VRISLGVVGLVALVSFPAVAQDSTHALCRASACLLVFDWSNGSTQPDPDRRYGSPSDLETAFRAKLTAAGYKLTASPPAAATITIRLTPQTRALCDTMEGMNPDYSCHTVARATILLSSGDPNAGSNNRIDVTPRCRDPKLSISMSQFGQYAGDLVVYTLAADPKSARPNAKC
jgi:hypothetical protein